MKKLLAILVLTALVFTLAACGGATASSTAPPATVSTASGESAQPAAGAGRVAFICKGYSDPMCLLVMNMYKEYSEENYADVYTTDYFDGETNADKINKLIETCTANAYDVIVMQQQDSDAPVALIKAAVAAGTDVVVTVGSVNDDGESYYIDSDPSEQGTIIAQYAVDQGFLKEGTKVGILQGPAAQFHSNGRTDAYTKIINEVGADLVAQDICEWETALAQTTVENWLVAHPDLEVILSCSDSMSLGAIEAIKLAGTGSDIKIFSVDATEEGCLAIAAGDLYATVAQDIFSYSHDAADFAAKLIKGEPVESKICTSQLVTQDNVKEMLMSMHGYTQEQVDALG